MKLFYAKFKLVCNTLMPITGICPMDLNSPVFAMRVRIFRASNDVGPLFVGPAGFTRILEKKTHNRNYSAILATLQTLKKKEKTE
jgi:hypothetical protein